jgi:hypothetical protein|tara:strand:- start:249 stop:485 length:237 start_codon:yes stop_codon:yes gene_type:complete
MNSSTELNYKRFATGKAALEYIQSQFSDWEAYLNDFAEIGTPEKDWTSLDEVSLRGIADGLAESDAELADGKSNPDAL